MEPFIGEIRMTAFNFAPVGWALCNGQWISIAQNTALFSLLGTTYGGDGQTTFGLPDLRGRFPTHWGQGNGLSPRVQGEMAGVERVSLLTSQLPAHTHTLSGTNVAPNAGSPNAALLPTTSSESYSSSGTANTPLNPTAVGATGGSQPHENMPPYVVLNFIIATQGIFPSRP